MGRWKSDGEVGVRGGESLMVWVEDALLVTCVGVILMVGSDNDVGSGSNGAARPGMGVSECDHPHPCQWRPV
ncbi:hypothetical protein HaLaN_11695 [Haematococcus lacustris]|uniref:Uncharacterized protein n=1 Tax=Haematococcus lacustris TaxID=44745 RepID=A0A699ZIG5_HAELA|nr:hypothetical protein HaLaN_11695 [Haematococcus lacustris]